jgi:hypothetical protein
MSVLFPTAIKKQRREKADTISALHVHFMHACHAEVHLSAASRKHLYLPET